MAEGPRDGGGLYPYQIKNALIWLIRSQLADATPADWPFEEIDEKRNEAVENILQTGSPWRKK